MINVTYTATAFSIFYMHRILLEATHALLLTASGSASRMRISWGGRGVWRERGGGGGGGGGGGWVGLYSQVGTTAPSS
jgi:hypothetical protein